MRIHRNNQKLIFQRKVLENNKYLIYYKIEEYDVIYLVETDSRQYQERPSSNTNSNANSNSYSNLGEYERLINSIFPSFHDILESLRSNNNNNNQNNNNQNSNNQNNNIQNNNPNIINERSDNNENEGIFDSFNHLLKHKTYNYIKTGEVINSTK